MKPDVPFPLPTGFTPDVAKEIWRRLRKFAAAPLDLSWFIGWRDVLTVACPVCIVRGVALWSVPAAWITAGLFAGAVAYLLAVGAAAKAVPQPPPEQG